jgi:hypothetical protein
MTATPPDRLGSLQAAAHAIHNAAASQVDEDMPLEQLRDELHSLRTIAEAGGRLAAGHTARLGALALPDSLVLRVKLGGQASDVMGAAMGCTHIAREALHRAATALYTAETSLNRIDTAPARQEDEPNA